MLHILLAPAPQTIEDILLTKLHGDHHTIRHALCASIVVLHVRHIAHRVAHLEVDLVRPTKYIVEHFLQLGVYFILLVAHLHKKITVLARLKRALLPRCQCHRLDGQHHQRC